LVGSWILALNPALLYILFALIGPITCINLFRSQASILELALSRFIILIVQIWYKHARYCRSRRPRFCRNKCCRLRGQSRRCFRWCSNGHHCWSSRSCKLRRSAIRQRRICRRAGCLITIRKRGVQVDEQTCRYQQRSNHDRTNPPGLVDLLIQRNKLELDPQPQADRQYADDEHDVRQRTA
jgi:hypothetical protein